MTSSSLAKRAHEALEHLLTAHADMDAGADECSAPHECWNKLEVAIAALAAAQGGHAQNCGCCNAAPIMSCHPEHPYRDPRCALPPTPESIGRSASNNESPLQKEMNRLAEDCADRLLADRNLSQRECLLEAWDEGQAFGWNQHKDESAPLPSTARKKVREVLYHIGNVEPPDKDFSYSIRQARDLLESALAEPEQSDDDLSDAIAKVLGSYRAHFSSSSILDEIHGHLFNVLRRVNHAEPEYYKEEPESKMPSEEELQRDILSVLHKDNTEYHNRVAVARLIRSKATGWKP